MNKFCIGAISLTLLATATLAAAQKDKADEDEGPTSWVYFLVVKDDNGKPVRNAAVVLHPVSGKGRQERGGLELKTDPEGKANFEGIPYGMLRVQVLAQGFQTYGEDFDIQKEKMELTIKLKRPQSQYSIYEDHPSSNPPPKQDPPPQDEKKPN